MSPSITYLGRVNYRADTRTFGIKRTDRRQHMYMVGKTGVGKSTLLAHMIAQDIQRGEGVGIIDPHGDLAELVLQYVPPHRINDCIYVNPADDEYPLAMNPLDLRSRRETRGLERQVLSSSLISTIKFLFGDSWGPRLEHTLRNTILALLEVPGTTLLSIPQMLSDERYRNQIVRQVQDPVVQRFWTETFSRYTQAFGVSVASPIENKVGQFLASSVIRNMVTQPRSTFNLDTIMDNRQILIVNLAKGKIGLDNASLLGALLITNLYLSALARAKVREDQRPDFYLYVDEFQNFATQSFAHILSEARKYHLNLILAHQHLAQLPLSLQKAILGNVGSLISFRLGMPDAPLMTHEFNDQFSINDFLNLGRFEAYIKLLIDGSQSHPFSMATLPMGTLSKRYDRKDTIIQVSRQRYGRPREEVERNIQRALGNARGLSAP